VDSLDRLQATNPLVFDLILWGSVALLVLVFVHVAWVFARTLRAASAVGEAASARRPAPRRDAAWYSREADRLAAAGRYAEALQAAMTGLALRLDASGAVRYHPSKTPSEYAREARLAPEDGQRLRALVRSLYRFAFAGAPCGEADYRRWRAETEGPWHVAAA
jgi:hypothetical protein